jgi:hypothetical protein
MQNINSRAALLEERGEIPALGIMRDAGTAGTGNIRHLPVVGDF